MAAADVAGDAIAVTDVPAGATARDMVACALAALAALSAAGAVGGAGRLAQSRLCAPRAAVAAPRMLATPAPLADSMDSPGRSKVDVQLAPYADGSIAVSVERVKVDEAAIEKALAANAKTSELISPRFAEGAGGARMGHTVVINFDGAYASGGAQGYAKGQAIPGTKASMFELDLKEGHKLPFSAFVPAIAAGMGQDELKAVQVSFPDDYASDKLAGVTVNFKVTVKKILQRVAKEADARSPEEQRADIVARLEAQAQAETDKRLDKAIRAVYSQRSVADVQKQADAVSWAKFGEKSLEDYKWQMILEEVARAEGCTFDKVLPLLRSHASVTYT